MNVFWMIFLMVAAVDLIIVALALLGFALIKKALEWLLD